MYYIIASVLKICGMICGNRIINGYVSILVNHSEGILKSDTNFGNPMFVSLFCFLSLNKVQKV